MLNLELLAQSDDHSVVKGCTVVSNDPFGDAVPANEPGFFDWILVASIMFTSEGSA